MEQTVRLILPYLCHMLAHDTYYIPYTMCVCFVFTEQTVRLILPHLCLVQHVYDHVIYVLPVSALC